MFRTPGGKIIEGDISSLGLHCMKIGKLIMTVGESTMLNYRQDSLVLKVTKLRKASENKIFILFSFIFSLSRMS